MIGDGGFVYLLASGGAAPGSINFDFTTGILPPGITFTRPSIGTYNSSGNLLVTAGNNVARFNYIGGVANLLIEGSATNIFTQSNNFSAADWLLTNTPVITSAQFISPDGTNNGWSYNDGNSNAWLQQWPVAFASGPYTLSLWIKRIIGTGDMRFGLAGVTQIVTVSATLQRLSATLIPGATSDSASYRTTTANGSSSGIYGAQLETGSVMTSYIPTTTVAVTRAADSAVFTIPAGIGHLTFTFDDNTTQTVVVSPGSYTIPATLNRPNIKSIVGSA